MTDSIFKQIGSVVKNAVETEQTARINADTTLQTNITAETTARINAFNTLQTNINNIDITQELNDLTNVDLTTHTPAIGDNLTFNGTKWIPASFGTSEHSYTTPGTYYWLCPQNVTSVSVVCVGGGGSGWIYSSYSKGAGGGGLGWKNNIPVTPGQSYMVIVGAGGTKPTISSSTNCGNSAGGDSYFISTSTVKGGGGGAGVYSSTNTYGGTGGTYTGDGGGNGGNGGSNYSYCGGGGGAGGYSGNGGSAYYNTTGAVSTTTTGNSSTGGGGGAGGGGYSGDTAGSGGGVGLFGLGTNGAGGAGGTYDGCGGSGGSGGNNAAYAGGTSVDMYSTTNLNTPGIYGGGSGASDGQLEVDEGGNGAVRIIWGTGRSFPNSAS